MEEIKKVVKEEGGGQLQRSELKLINRKNLNITGLSKVIGADERRVTLVVAGSVLNIAGRNLHIERLDVAGGFVDILGQVDEMKFQVEREKGNLFKRLIK